MGLKGSFFSLLSAGHITARHKIPIRPPVLDFVALLSEWLEAQKSEQVRVRVSMFFDRGFGL